MDSLTGKSREQLAEELEKVRRELDDLRRRCAPPEGGLADCAGLYKSLSDATFEAIFLSDKGVCIGQNRAARDMFGYSDEEALGRMGTEWIHEDYRDMVMRNMMEQVVSPYNAVALRKDGTTFACEIRASMTMQGDKPVRVTALRDISGRIEAEQALRQSEERFRRLADNAKDMIYRMSVPDGVYEFVSPASLDIFGYTPEEFYANPMLIRELIHPDWRAYPREKWDDLCRGVVPDFYEYQIRHRNGEVRCLNQRNTLILDGEGRPAFIEGIVTDITWRKEAEEQRVDFDRMFRHDMRTPLAGILSAPKVLMAEGNLTEFQQEVLEAVEEASYKMLGLLRISLELPRLENGTFEPETTVFDLAALIRRTISLQTSYAGSKRLRVWFTVEHRPAQASGKVIQGDEILLFSMVTNLYRNALEAAPEGTAVTIDLSDAGSSVVIEIRNQGAVPASVRDRFFEKYVTAGKAKGVGLGTYSAMLVARAHGGTIVLDCSEPDATCVRVALPGSVRV